jgi:hypothetical protein
MKGSVFKFHRCPEKECKSLKREFNPPKKAPPCPTCKSTRAYYTDNWHISVRTPKGKQIVESVSPFKEVAEKKLEELINGRF